MIKWEYKLHNSSATNIQQELNTLGSEGWELVHTQHQSGLNPYDQSFLLILKRLVPSPMKEVKTKHKTTKTILHD